jgi:hypothetical protein
LNLPVFLGETILMHPQRIRVFLVTLLLKGLLDFCYLSFVAPVYGYTGMVLSPNSIKIAESWFLVAIMAAFSVPTHVGALSVFFSNVNFYLFFVPLSTIYGYGAKDRVFFYSIALVTGLAFLVRRIPRVRVIAPQISLRALQAWCIGFLSFGTGILLFKIGVSTFSLTIGDEYFYREVVNEKLGDSAVNYFMGWLHTILGPLALLIALSRRAYVAAAIVGALHVVWFGLTSHKTPAAVPFAILALWTFRGFLSRSSLLPILLGSVTVLSMSVFWIFGSSLVPAVIVRRIFFVPPMLTFVYQEYFSMRDPIYWASVSGSLSTLSGDLSEGFEKAVGNYLGIGGHANAGFFAAGFAQAGYLGFALYGLLFLGLLYLADCFSNRGAPLIYSVAALFMPISILITSSDFTTIILSHGMLVAVIILYFLNGCFSSSVQRRA